MRRSPRLAALAVAALAGAGLTACDHDAADAKKAAAAKCPATITGAAKQQPPAEVPLPQGATQAYSFLAQGKTTYYYFALSGGPGALTGDRNGYDAVLRAHGYRIGDTDQESGIEAESDFSGPHDGHTRWRNLCQGHVSLQLQLNN